MSGRKFKPSQPPGVAGGRRHIPDQVQRQQRARANDRRVSTSLAATREQQDELDALILSQQAEADRLEAERIERMSAERQLAARRAAVSDQAKRETWNLGQARDLVRQGYSIEGTIARTGWPREMLQDVEMGEW